MFAWNGWPDFHCALVLRIFTPQSKCRVSFVGQYTLDDETFMSVLFGNFDLIGDILDTKYKLDLYCYLARFILIQRLTCDGIA